MSSAISGADTLTLAELRAKTFRSALDDVTDKFCHSTSDTERNASNLLWFGLPAYRTLKPSLSSEVRGRKLWDLGLSSARRFALDAPRAYFVRLLGGALGCGEAVEKARVLAERSLELSKRGLQVHQAELRYDLALEKVVAHVADPHLLPLYASLQAFPEDTKVKTYVTQSSEYERRKLEILLEGPLQLVLSLSDDGLMAILRLPLWLGGRDEPELAELTTVVKACRDKLQEAWGDGGFLRATVTILDETIDLYAERLEDKLMTGRAFVPSLEARRRFITAFEMGQYREKADV